MQLGLRPPAVDSRVAISRRMKAPSTFRLDRALSLSVAKPLLRLTEDPRTSKLPILMYHGISDETGDRHPYYETNTSPSRFAEQMRYLHEEGYRIVGLDTISDCMKAERPAERRVVITFDDGYRNFFSTALPILAAHGFSATVFVVSGYAQQASICDQSRVHMNWSEVREISRCGMAVGSHTVSHCVLRDLAPGSLRYELNESKRVIESEVGGVIGGFAYPFAFPENDTPFKDRARDVLQSCGYRQGVCTSIGRVWRGSDVFFLPRIPINTHDDLRLFKAKLEGAYDWVHLPQVLYKRAVTQCRSFLAMRNHPMLQGDFSVASQTRSHEAVSERETRPGSI